MKMRLVSTEGYLGNGLAVGSIYKILTKDNGELYFFDDNADFRDYDPECFEEIKFTEKRGKDKALKYKMEMLYERYR